MLVNEYKKNSLNSQLEFPSQDPNIDIIDQLLSNSTNDLSHQSLTIDDMLSGLIYISIKSQIADAPLLLELIRNFTLYHRQA